MLGSWFSRIWELYPGGKAWKRNTGVCCLSVVQVAARMSKRLKRGCNWKVECRWKRGQGKKNLSDGLWFLRRQCLLYQISKAWFQISRADVLAKCQSWACRVITCICSCSVPHTISSSFWQCIPVMGGKNRAEVSVYIQSCYNDDITA